MAQESGNVAVIAQPRRECRQYVHGANTLVSINGLIEIEGTVLCSEVASSFRLSVCEGIPGG